MIQKDSAIVIKKIDYSETSQILHFITAKSGKTAAIAKGAKRAKTNFYGPLDLCSLYEILYIDKRSMTLDILTGCALIDAHRKIRRDFRAFSAASYVAEFTGVVIAPGQHIEGYFPLVRETLRRLDGGTAPLTATVAFELAALRLTGFLPRTAACVICNSDVRSIDTPFFSVRGGGTLCPDCARTAKGNDPMRFRVHHELLLAFAELARDPDGLASNGCSDETLHGLRRVLDPYISSIMERPATAVKYLAY